MDAHTILRHMIDGVRDEGYMCRILADAFSESAERDPIAKEFEIRRKRREKVACALYELANEFMRESEETARKEFGWL